MTLLEPVISLNALAEFCYATPVRRRAIIADMAKESFDVYKNWYGEVPGAYKLYLASQCTDDEKLSSLEALLIRRQPQNDQDDEKALKQLDALELIRQTDHRVLTKSATLSAYNFVEKSLWVSGVRVRVSPSNLVKSHSELESGAIGVLKPYIKKGRPLSQREAQTIATLLHWFTEEQLSKYATSSPSLSAVIDVFGRKITKASAKDTNLRRTIVAGCEEIYERWPAHAPTGKPAVQQRG